MTLRDAIGHELEIGLPPATEESARRFLTVMDAFDNGEIALTPYLDWAGKKFVLDNAETKYKAMGIKGDDLFDRLQAIDLAWYDINPEKSAFQKLVDRGAIAFPYSTEQFERATSLLPPRDTRAYARAIMARLSRWLSEPVVGSSSGFNWETIKHYYNFAGIHGTVEPANRIADPFDPFPSEMLDEIPSHISLHEQVATIIDEIGPPNLAKVSNPESFERVRTFTGKRTGRWELMRRFDRLD